MSLHHQPRIHDMRTASRYDGRDREPEKEDNARRRQQHDSTQRWIDEEDKRSNHGPTYGSRGVETTRRRDYTTYFDDRQMEQSPTSSVETYASTVDSEEDQPEDIPEYDVPEYTAHSLESSALAATPSDFSELFPSNRVLEIRHDDTTVDGNMNLRVDTQVAVHGRRCEMTLFHLRIQDLKHREFSLRRYHRNSGREVCHSVRKHAKPAGSQRPTFHRSLSNALQNIRPRPEHRSSTSPAIASLKRNDSGYASMHSVDLDRDDISIANDQSGKTQDVAAPSSVRLEFSNYAQIEVKRTGVKGNKRYEFEYWGVGYAWRRVVRKDHGSKQISYYLTRTGSDRSLATIDPFDLDELQALEERRSGGWIPPCEMQITDNKIIDSPKDVADSVVAAGLVALVDDSIRRHFHSEEAKQLLIPVPRMSVEYIGPKRLINEMFNRKDSSSGQQSRPSSSGGPSSTGTSANGRRRPGSSRQSSR